MTLDEGATNEILIRWPEHKQRNTALVDTWYGEQYKSNMIAGIQVVRDRHEELQNAGATTWSIDQATSDLLDQLAQNTTQFFRQ